MGRKFSNTLIVVLLACAFAVCLTNSGQAFDGKRKGFVIGFGLGVAPVMYQGDFSQDQVDYKRSYPGTDTFEVDYTFAPFFQSNSRSGVAMQIDIGYAWSERDMITYREQHAFYSRNDIWSQGISAICWSHYYGANSGPFFSTVGLGYFSLNNLSDNKTFGGIDDGIGLLAGLGYQFKRHFNCELTFSQGPASSGLIRCSNLMLTVTTTAF